MIRQTYVVYFNPRSHERSDDTHIDLGNTTDKISIHAPTRGATEAQQILPRNNTYFNPRSHERSDYTDDNMPNSMKISIHAPTRGATEPIDNDIARLIFQSTLPREERLTIQSWTMEHRRFQSTLPREERPNKQFN